MLRRETLLQQDDLAFIPSRGHHWGEPWKDVRDEVGAAISQRHPMNASAAVAEVQPRPAAVASVPRVLPSWCDAYLAEPESGDFFASRLWFDTLVAHALPAGAQPRFATCGDGAVMLPLLNRGLSLTSPYTLEWRPLPRVGASAEDARRSGAAVARARRFAAPLRLEAMDPERPLTAAFLAGAAEGGASVLRFQHFGNWHEALPSRTSWASYLGARPPALRSTIQRKLARAARSFRFELLAEPGTALEAGIAAYEEVRRQSWKPTEPAPRFDAALMRATAAAGCLRLGILREGETGAAVAAQYWVIGGGRAYLLKLCHVEAARAASPGTALTALMIRGLIEGDAVGELDFGRGDDDYKQLWVGQRRQRFGVLLASALHPAGLLAIARHRAAAWVRSRRARPA